MGKFVVGKVFGVSYDGVVGVEVFVLKILDLCGSNSIVEVGVFFIVFYDLALVGIMGDVYYGGKGLVDVGC